MRTAIIVAAYIVRWAILQAADKDPRFSGKAIVFAIVLLGVAFLWDLFEDKK